MPSEQFDTDSPDSSSLDLSLDEDNALEGNDESETAKILNYEILRTKTFKNILKNLDVSPLSLSSSGHNYLERIAELMALVQLYDLNHDNFCESFVRELGRRDQLDREVVLRKKQVDIINKKLNTIHKKFELLKNHVQGSSNTPDCVNTDSEKQSQFQYLAAKCSKYSTQIAHLRRRLDISTKYCTHANLSNRAEHLTQLRKQISTMKSELDTYIEFPADINMAKVKLEEAKRQLELLDQNLSLKIDMSKS